ncbi:phosphoribosyl 1,2-cyclic phosphate phosphodiesterase [Sphingomonas sp. SORGH_AS870]|uniref:MBL fold metallo-hydrolase n=1 Tax=Sphingomonas sp. SORGH_AS_0870 TaxID=3041801 RepID=UPI00285E90A6|nr:MBL fold metallo-hydrolase [Sphingomonas sp. SORGH_AS_0870]MDR6146576.1 phosphoribosyl 1,2-cyclic phosphate phosphodiesterase [Sphingomonas sp. SORGH_AS_0870]
MKLRILGCGTSSGVPRIGNDWGACDPTEPRNRRMRMAALVEHGDTRILIDTGPDMREQLLAANVATVDAVLWTHDHADHCHGIDDLRQIFHALGEPVSGYARPATAASLENRFGYVFHGKTGYPPTATMTELGDSLTIGDIHIRTVDQPHGRTRSAGFRFECDGNSIGYATDFHELTPEMAALYRDLDIWIVDALRRHPHPAHADLPSVLDWIAMLRPRRSVLIHMDQSMDYATLRRELPDGVEPAYDGMDLIP